MVGCGHPPWSACGGLATARLGTPASCAGHDVHDDAARVDREATGHVEAHPVDRDPALGDGAALGDRGRRVGAPLVGVHEPGPPDRLLQRGAHGGVEGLQGGDDVRGHPQAAGRMPSKRSAAAYSAGGAVLADVRDDRAHGIQRRLDVEAARGTAARSSRSEVPPRRSSRGMTPVAAGVRGWDVPRAMRTV